MDKENVTKIETLAEKFLLGIATEQEKQELHQWYDEWKEGEEQIQSDTDTEELIKARVFERIKERMALISHPVNLAATSYDDTFSKVEGERGRLRKLVWRWAVAASIILLAGIGYFLSVNREKPGVKQELVSHDVKAPETNRAMITFGDGRKVFLDSAGIGTLANEGTVSIVKLGDGKISYQPALNGHESAIQYNALFNPRGSKIVSLILSDGTKVWLNSESSLKYPTVFAGNERRVEMTGEAYFEVEHDAKKPFHVTVNGMDVQVLGTHFNINAYNDESEMRTTLLEGEVRITKGESVAVLSPGNQAQVINDNIKLVKNVDVNQVIAWQKGMFEFEHLELPVIMRQISRWYDVDVSYVGNIPTATFGGGISKNLPLSSVMESLRSAGIHLGLEGKKLIVTH
jgi:ferric-dicitrate binding protein FerR (iron transport regulator)